MLAVRDVVKSFSGRAVVNQVTFDVQPGEIFALLGPNGAGKTTLIRMITDILKPDSGRILLDGKPVGGEQRARVAYLPEERGVYKRVGLVDSLVYFGLLRGLTQADARASARRLLDQVELGAHATKQVQMLSKGMQQKLQLCTALIGDPRLLILDEPFTGLDPINVQLFERVLAERRAAGSTVLLSTHQMNKVEEQCDRALMINRGHMVLYGPVREIRRQHSGHAVRVNGTNVPAALPGVSAVVAENGGWRLDLEPATQPDAVLRSLIEHGAHLHSFMLDEPPLEDIFIKVVTEGLGLDGGESGPPTVDEPLTAVGAR
ncbi:MAG TPA: ATP-binding cassette domain-containing protein [Candidatus Saccharimonadaceae bacterium]|nr:ATP-binding cassette domain-containing protein [Candidatus Saccharimonadaceae bacterium]